MLDCATASQLHQSGDSYTVLVGSASAPACFINVMKNKGWVSTSFLDSKLREYLLYNFRLMGEETLFLSMAVHRQFADDSEQVVSGTTYIFAEDGRTLIREERIAPYALSESEMTSDISAHYDHFPDFGHYQCLTRIER